MFKVKVYNFLFETISALFYNCWAFALIKSNSLLTDLARAFGLFMLAQAALQIPTGIFADKVGRKSSLTTGLCLCIFGALLISLFKLNWAGFLVIGAAFSFIDGAKSAWFRDISAIHTDFESDKNDTHFYFRLDLVGRFATAIASFVGISIASLGVNFFWSLLILLCLLVVIVINFNTHNEKSPTAAEYKAPLNFNLKLPFAIFLVGSLFYGLEFGLRNLAWQPYVDHVSKGNTNYFGWFFLIASTSRLLGNLFYRKLHSEVRNNFSLLTLIPLLIFGASQINASQTDSFLIFIIPYALALFSLGIFFPVRETLLNRLTNDKWRATALSIDSMVWLTTGGVILLSISGGSQLSLETVWIYSGLSIAVCGILYSKSAKFSKIRVN